MTIEFVAADQRNDSAEDLVLSARSARLWAAAAAEVAKFYEAQAAAALRRAGATKREARRTLGSRRGDLSVYDEDVQLRVGYLSVLLDPEDRPMFTPFADSRRNAVAVPGSVEVPSRGELRSRFG
jgi:hypothetical protein